MPLIPCGAEKILRFTQDDKEYQNDWKGKERERERVEKDRRTEEQKNKRTKEQKEEPTVNEVNEE